MAEVEFRTGKREIPDHLSELMQGIETQRLTYEEAVEEANRRALGTHIDKSVDLILRGHFSQGLIR